MNKELQFLIYNTPIENTKINVIVKEETIWLTQKAMSELFDCSTDNVSLHLKNIYESNELNELSTTEDFSVVQQEGKREIKTITDFNNISRCLLDKGSK